MRAVHVGTDANCSWSPAFKRVGSLAIGVTKSGWLLSEPGTITQDSVRVQQLMGVDYKLEGTLSFQTLQGTPPLHETVAASGSAANVRVAETKDVPTVAVTQ